jgi:hypothetical protein
MEFKNVGKRGKVTDLKKYDDVYCDMLVDIFNQHTGLQLPEVEFGEC